jgi:hypothetical protein
MILIQVSADKIRDGGNFEVNDIVNINADYQ